MSASFHGRASIWEIDAAKIKTRMTSATIFLTGIRAHVGRRQEFFYRGGHSGNPGEGSAVIFEFPGGDQPQFMVASMVKIKEFRNQEDIPPCLYACLRLCTGSLFVMTKYITYIICMFNLGILLAKYETS